MNQLDVASQKRTRALDKAEMRVLCEGPQVKKSCYGHLGLSKVINRKLGRWLSHSQAAPAPNEDLRMRPRGASIGWGWDESSSSVGAMTSLHFGPPPTISGVDRPAATEL